MYIKIVKISSLRTCTIEIIHQTKHLDTMYDDSCSRSVQYLTRKARGVEPSIEWNSTKMVGSLGQSTKNRIEQQYGQRDVAEKRKCDDQIESRCAKLRRCSRMVNFATYAEMLKQSPQFDICTQQSMNDDGNKQLKATFQIYPDFPVFDYPKDEPQPFVAPEMNCTRCESASNISSFSSLSSLASFSKSRSIRLSAHTVAELTVLLIDIQGFTAECAALPAGRVGEWVAAFYARVEKVAAKHGVSKVEVRGDCCICVAGADGAVPSRALVRDASADRRCDQATRMLAFAAALHSNLATLTAGSGGSAASTAARMGIATGEAAFLISDAADRGAAPFASLRGEAVDLAQRMEALARPGAVYVHRSTADKWAGEVRQPPPPSTVVEVEGRGPQRVAVYDCAARAFDASPADGAGARRGAAAAGGGEAGRLRCRCSATF